MISLPTLPWLFVGVFFFFFLLHWPLILIEVFLCFDIFSNSWSSCLSLSVQDFSKTGFWSLFAFPPFPWSSPAFARFLGRSGGVPLVSYVMWLRHPLRLFPRYSPFTPSGWLYYTWVQWWLLAFLPCLVVPLFDHLSLAACADGGLPPWL